MAKIRVWRDEAGILHYLLPSSFRLTECDQITGIVFEKWPVADVASDPPARYP